MLGIKVSDFFYYSRRFRKRKKKKIRPGGKGVKYFPGWSRCRKKVQLVSSNSTEVHHRHDRVQSYSSARVNDFVDSSGLTTDTVIWEYMCKVGKNLAHTSLLKLSAILMAGSAL